MNARTPGQLYPTGVATVGGRGQQAAEPHPEALHTVLMTTETTHTHEDRFVTAEQAIQSRISRFRESKTLYTRDGMTLRYIDSAGAKITLTYSGVDAA